MCEYHFSHGPGDRQVTIRKLNTDYELEATYIVTLGEKPWCTCPAMGHARKGHNFSMASHKHVIMAREWLQGGAKPHAFFNGQDWESRQHEC